MNKPNREPEISLDSFKEGHLKNNDLLLYAETKKRISRYRLIFILIGLLFLALSWIIWSKSSFWMTASVKPLVNFITLSLGFASFSIAGFLRYEHEAVRTLYHQTLRHLRQVYRIRQTKAFKDADLPLNEMIRKKLALRAHFKQTQEKLKKLELETFELMRRISLTQELSLKDKETLYEQALLELKEHYTPVVEKYIS